MIKIMAIIFSCYFIAGCTTAAFTKTKDSHLSTGSSKDCQFNLYTHPPKSYEEVGVIQFVNYFIPSDGAGNIIKARNLSKKYVCQNGGNGLLFAEVKGLANYTKATVIHVNE
jgi:hypothetical protein